MTNKEKARQHAKRPHYCSCGAVAHGNGGWSSHRAMHERRGDGHHGVTRDAWERAKQGAVADGGASDAR